MKYVYTGGEYAEFRGYVFWRRRPTMILDKGTLIAIAMRPDFKPYTDPVEAPKQPRKKLRLPAKELI